MKDMRDTSANSNQRPQPSVPTHGNWAQERGFGQQVSPSSDPKQHTLELIERQHPTRPTILSDE